MATIIRNAELGKSIARAAGVKRIDIDAHTPTGLPQNSGWMFVQPKGSDGKGRCIIVSKGSRVQETHLRRFDADQVKAMGIKFEAISGTLLRLEDPRDALRPDLLALLFEAPKAASKAASSSPTKSLLDDLVVAEPAASEAPVDPALASELADEDEERNLDAGFAS